MRKLLTFIFSSIMFFPLSQALAVPACGIDLNPTDTANSFEADCSSCQTINDYALTGSAFIESQRGRSLSEYATYNVLVTNGDTAVSVEVQLATRSINNNVMGVVITLGSIWDKSANLVSAYAISGNPRGTWATQNRVPSSTSDHKCDQLKKEEAAKPENWDWSEIELTLNFSEAYFNSPAWSYLLSATQGYGSLDFYVPYDTCSACGSEPEPGSATAPNAPTMDFDEYNLGFM